MTEYNFVRLAHKKTLQFSRGSPESHILRKAIAAKPMKAFEQAHGVVHMTRNCGFLLTSTNLPGM